MMSGVCGQKAQQGQKQDEKSKGGGRSKSYLSCKGKSTMQGFQKMFSRSPI